MLQNILASNDSVQSLFDGYPLTACPSCLLQDCICHEQRPQQKSSTDKELIAFRERKQLSAMRQLQKFFKEEDAPLCRFK